MMTPNIERPGREPREKSGNIAIVGLYPCTSYDFYRWIGLPHFSGATIKNIRKRGHIRCAGIVGIALVKWLPIFYAQPEAADAIHRIGSVHVAHERGTKIRVGIKLVGVETLVVVSIHPGWPACDSDKSAGAVGQCRKGA
jgi:hypothetical protein